MNLSSEVDVVINEKKIRLMTRTAIYEKHEGKEDLKINQYCGGDYVRFNMLKTLIGVTITVFLCSCIYVLYSSEDIFVAIFRIDYQALAKLLLTAYVLALIVYVIISLLYYEIKYLKTSKRLKRFKKNLEEIEKLAMGLDESETSGGND